jgi:diguanylate cyclase (GGDEF)-like protein
VIDLGRTLTRKFILLLLGFLLLQAVQLGAGLYEIRHLGDEASRVGETGKQRARLFLLANLAQQAIANGSWDNAPRALFHATLRESDDYFPWLESFVRESRLPEADLLALVAQARHAWVSEMRPLVAQLDPTDPPAARARLVTYQALALVQVERIDQIVRRIEADIREDTRWLMVVQAVAVGLSLVLGILGIVMARYIVSLPLRRLIEAARAIADGAYDRHITIRSRDELGELAATFNRMAVAIREKTARIEALNDIAIQLTSLHSLRELPEAIMQRGMQLSGTQAACIAFYNEQSGLFDRRIAHGLSERFLNSMSFRPRGLAGQAFASGTWILSDDRPQTRHKLSRLAREEGIRAFICLPLASHASRLGVIYFYRKDRDYFLREEIGILNTFAHLAAGAIEGARLQEQTQDLAITDKLTGLRNRRLFDQRFDEEIAHARREGRPLSLLLLDVDDFKRINDGHGHAAGDAVLQSLGHALAELLWRTDFAARYGGEEFAVILPQTGWSAARRVAERIRTYVQSMPVALPSGRVVSVTVSIGIAVFPDCGRSAADLIERADQALYTAKREGKNAVRLYRDTLKLQLEREPGRIVELLNQSLDNIAPIVTAVCAKADFYHRHTEVVEQAAMQLAQALQLSAADQAALSLASRLHDLGMIVIPDALLRKRSALTAQEWQVLRQHPATGAEFLEQVPALRHLAPIVRHHHERYDGSGYPDGLKGDATPYLARVLAVADTYGSMITDWPGRTAMSPAEAREALLASAGSGLDPQIVAAFVAALDRRQTAPS